VPIPIHRPIARRRLLIALGTGALSLPLASFAQQRDKVRRVGFLTPLARPRALEFHRYGAFLKGMRELGYIEGKDLIVEWRFADGRYELLPSLARELVQLKVDVIVAAATPAARAAQQATNTIPIVLTTISDPVGLGFIKSLARPGGNITGLANLTSDISPKHLEMLHSIVPKLSRVAVLTNPSNQSHADTLTNLQAAAQKTTITVFPVQARTPQEIDAAFRAMVQQNAGAVIIVADAFFSQQVRQIADLSANFRLPSMSSFREDVEVGGLMSYGQNRAEIFRYAATYVDKILKGAKPGDLPVEQPTKLELVINRKTAKGLGLAIPKELLLRADEVIE